MTAHPNGTQGQQSAAKGAGGASTTRLTESLKRAFKKDATKQQSSAGQRGSGVAQVPSTVLTVEYVDGSEGMSAALNRLEERLTRLEALTRQLQEASSKFISEASERIQQTVEALEALNRRLDGALGAAAAGADAGKGQLPRSAGSGPPFPAQFTTDEAHQKAWQVAQLVASDLETYYEEELRQGVLQGDFHERLQGPISKARQTYQERVEQRVLEEFDYFSLALERLIARKRRELARQQQAP